MAEAGAKSFMNFLEEQDVLTVKPYFDVRSVSECDTMGLAKIVNNSNISTFFSKSTWPYMYFNLQNAKLQLLGRLAQEKHLFNIHLMF